MYSRKTQEFIVHIGGVVILANWFGLFVCLVEYIIGRMGVPHRDKSVNIICVAIDAPQDKINSLAGRIGRLSGVTAKTLYSAS